jgi:hypothetical protein
MPLSPGTRRPPSAALLGLVVALVAFTPSSWAWNGKDGWKNGDEYDDTVIELEIARIYIEFNSTDNDLGFHVLLDGEDWAEIEIFNPDGLRIFEVEGQGAYGDLGLTELFFEGAEPSLDEVPLEELLDLFPEGEYEFEGETVDGSKIVGSGTLSHDIPDGPCIILPKSGKKVSRSNTVIQWKPVKSPQGIQIVGYEVIVGNSSFKLPASQTSLKVPPEILMPKTAYEFEVLAIEIGGNQTITSSSFVTQ